MARYSADGVLDPDFGAGGKVTAGSDRGPTAVILQADGKIVAAIDGPGGSEHFEVARYNADGSVDASFGTAGRVTTQFDDVSPAHPGVLAQQPDGKLVVAGQLFEADSGMV